MRLHEPTCRRKHLLKVGRRYHVKRGARIAPVELLKIHRDETLEVRDLETGGVLTLKSPRALREWMDRANIRFHRGSAEPEEAEGQGVVG